MTTKELIDLLQRLDPNGTKEVVFGIDYDDEYEKETIVGAETYDDDEVALYYYLLSLTQASDGKIFNNQVKKKHTEWETVEEKSSSFQANRNDSK